MDAKTSSAFDATMRSYIDEPIDLLSINDEKGEFRYINASKASYTRTIDDITAYFNSIGVRDYSGIRVLEIGAFLGFISIVLSEMGFSVTASDIPEFMKSQRMLDKYEKHGVKYVSTNLRDYVLPLESSQFDLVIMCETLEHLNFNPLPVIKEINRVLKPGGALYLSLPNIARLENRVRLLRGRSIHNPIGDFFAQLDRSKNMIVGLHWREYTGEEIRDMLIRLGFEVKKQYYFDFKGRSDIRSNFSLESLIRSALYRISPRLMHNQTTIACKCSEPAVDFHFYEATR